VSYCAVNDVAAGFPQFARNATGSISDTQIQGWIDDRKAQIRSAFLTRGFDPDAPPNPPLTGDQSNFLRALNRDGAMADLGDALQSTITLQPGEYSIAAARRSIYKGVLKEITQGLHDKLFQPTTARTQDVAPLIKAVAGGDQDTTSTPASTGLNQFFGKNQVF
jgi:hypothetical protein